VARLQRPDGLEARVQVAPARRSAEGCAQRVAGASGRGQRRYVELSAAQETLQCGVELAAAAGPLRVGRARVARQQCLRRDSRGTRKVSLSLRCEHARQRSAAQRTFSAGLRSKCTTLYRRHAGVRAGGREEDTRKARTCAVPRDTRRAALAKTFANTQMRKRWAQQIEHSRTHAQSLDALA